MAQPLHSVKYFILYEANQALIYWSTLPMAAYEMHVFSDFIKQKLICKICMGYKKSMNFIFEKAKFIWCWRFFKKQTNKQTNKNKKNQASFDGQYKWLCPMPID